jgi:hypothetical protein
VLPCTVVLYNDMLDELVSVVVGFITAGGLFEKVLKLCTAAPG